MSSKNRLVTLVAIILAGAVLCIGFAPSPVAADSSATAMPSLQCSTSPASSQSQAACASAGPASAIMLLAPPISESATPMPSQFSDLTAPNVFSLGTQFTAAPPPSSSSSTAGDPLSAALASLTPDQVAALLAALSNGQPNTTPSVAAPATLLVKRIAGKTASSSRGAKYGTIVSATASCSANSVLVGGGAQVTTSDGKNLDRAGLTQSYASDTMTWTAIGVVTDDNLANGQALQVTAVALCSQ